MTTQTREGKRECPGAIKPNPNVAKFIDLAQVLRGFKDYGGIQMSDTLRILARYVTKGHLRSYRNNNGLIFFDFEEFKAFFKNVVRGAYDNNQRGMMSLQSRYQKPKPESAVPPRNGDGPKFLTLTQAATYLGIPLKRVRILVNAHTLKRIPERTKGFRIAREELDRYVGEQIKNSF
jgi:excisionase family DNA binding protein